MLLQETNTPPESTCITCSLSIEHTSTFWEHRTPYSDLIIRQRPWRMNSHKRLRACHLQEMGLLAPLTIARPTWRKHRPEGRMKTIESRSHLTAPSRQVESPSGWVLFCTREKDTTSGNTWSHSMTDVPASLVPRKVPALAANCWKVQQRPLLSFATKGPGAFGKSASEVNSCMRLFVYQTSQAMTGVLPACLGQHCLQKMGAAGGHNVVYYSETLLVRMLSI